MAPLIYPEPTWSNRFGRVVRTLQIVAVAGAIGAVGGGVVVMALVGGGSSSRPPTALKVSTADSGKAATAHNGAASPAGAAPAISQPAAVIGTAQVTEAAAAATEAATQQPSPAAADPASHEAEQRSVEQAVVPPNSAAGPNVYNRVDPEQNMAPAPAPHARAKKITRRTKNAERGRHERGEPDPIDRETRYYSAQRGAPYAADRGGRYSGGRYSYRNYDPPPARGYYFGGGGFYDHGGWGD